MPKDFLVISDAVDFVLRFKGMIHLVFLTDPRMQCMCQTTYFRYNISLNLGVSGDI